MGFIVKKKGIWWVRVVVPAELVPLIRKKNLLESLHTKDHRIAVERAPAVIAKFQKQIAEARAKKRGYVYVPPTPRQYITTHMVTRGGFGGRMMLRDDAENLPAS
jgi:hypothetical protein